MPEVIELNQSCVIDVPKQLIKGKRNLTEKEINILKANSNINNDSSWKNIFVSDIEGEFDPTLIRKCEFLGYVIIGKLTNSALKFHDLVLNVGLYNSYLENVVLGDNVVIRNVRFLSNYSIGNRVMLFNIQEMSCTNHSKFGNGILKDGEPESNRIWIGVGNENDKRAVLPFEEMIPADAFIWSRFREDKELQQRFIEMTEVGNTKELNTVGIVEDDAIIKNTTLLKDVKVGANSYIKGAFKLKNITILSSKEEPSQIGEGVELVNGILGYGSKVFYQAVAVRFVIGRNCQLKYGARLLNSVLGDNSTVSCCEILNNLIFPFHEQHHNSSFLIASTLCGQTNIASGATIGSNHNSRSPDGEMFAGRGFWPGLCSDFKHNSRFACFTLVSKGSYQNELNIPYPFSLVASDGPCKPIHIIPAYWFLYNMYAVARNKSKFLKRDKRINKIQHIETNPIAPDSIQEIVIAIKRLIDLTADYLVENKVEGFENVKDLSYAEIRQKAKDYMHKNPDKKIVLEDPSCQKKYGALIYKPIQSYKEYRKIAKYFSVLALIDYCKQNDKEAFTMEDFEFIRSQNLFESWLNVGGQIIPKAKIVELFDNIKNKTINTWQEVHKFYDECEKNYVLYKATYAISILENLYSRPIDDFTTEIYKDIEVDVSAVNEEMYHATLSSRMKDYDDEFRMITFRNAREMEAVLGTITDNEFFAEMEAETKMFATSLKLLFKDICGL